GSARRVREGGPARVVRALRRRPREDQPAGRGVRRRHARADPGDRTGISAADEPDDPPCRGRGRFRRRRTMMRNTTIAFAFAAALLPAGVRAQETPPAPGEPRDFSLPEAR